MNRELLRCEVIRVYKALYHLGKEYPKGSLWFHNKLKAAFWRNRHETDPEKIKALIAKGDFIIKELETLYYLRKYRTLRQRYYE
ncbi:LYR motif-containing protein 5 [Toxocara canis]|uniref:LYR motif-containing protein 5 n=1 Tax=Toxocara canis TaxID=6265 RepID=A0A0B2VL21_TOXCA|nr:LYR motif-containing protein 5 [Toxocara canis]